MWPPFQGNSTDVHHCCTDMALLYFEIWHRTVQDLMWFWDQRCIQNLLTEQGLLTRTEFDR
jgi:hypothetical protein